MSHPAPYEEEIYEEYGYRRTATDPDTEDIVEKFEEMCHRYSTNLEQYHSTARKLDQELDQFERHCRAQREQNLSPVSDTMSEELITTIERPVNADDKVEPHSNTVDEVYTTVVVKRQPDSTGKYGFDYEQTDDGKVRVSSVVDRRYCPELSVGDEIVSIDGTQALQTYDQCESTLTCLWKNTYEDVQIAVAKASTAPIMTSEWKSLPPIFGTFERKTKRTRPSAVLAARSRQG